MAEQLIDDIVNTGAIKKQVNESIADLERFYAKYKDYKTKLTGLGGNNTFSDFTKGSKESQAALSGLSTELDIARKKIAENVIATKQLEAANKQAAAELKQQTLEIKKKAIEEKLAAEAAKRLSVEQAAAGRERILQLKAEQAEVQRLLDIEKGAASQAIPTGFTNTRAQLAKTPAPAVNVPQLTPTQGDIVFIKDYENSLKKLEIENKALQTSFAAGNITQKQFNQQIAVNSEKILGYKRVIADSTKELKLNAAVNDSQRNSIERANALVAKYTFEQSKLNLATKDGALQNDNYKKAIAKTNTFLKENNNEVVAQQKNIGNYGSALDKAGSAFTRIGAGASKFIGVLRTIAYAIPGIGLAGLLGLIIEPLVFLTKSLLGFGEVSEKIKRLQEESATAFKNSADAAAEEISKVTILKSVLESERTSRLQKIEALKQLKNVNIDYFGQLDLENGKVEGLGKQYDNYVSKIIKSINAKANVEQLTNALKLQNELVGKINDGFAKPEEKYTANNLTPGDIFKATQRFNLTFGTKKGQTRETNLNDLQVIADLLNAEIKVKGITDRIKDTIQDSFTPQKEAKESTKKAAAARQLSELQKRDNKEFENEKIKLERQLKNYEAIITSDKTYYLSKITALDEYVKKKQEINEKQRIQDEKLAIAEGKAEIARLNEQKTGKNGAQIARIDQNIAIVAQNTADKIKNINLKSADDAVEIATDGINRKNKIIEDGLAEELKNYQDLQKQLDDIDKKDDTERNKRIADRIKKEKEAAAVKLQLEKDLVKAKGDLALQSEKFLFELATAGFERQNNLLNQKKDAIDKQKEIDIAAADATITNEQDKAAAIAVINARAQSAKDAIERKQKENDYKKAKFEQLQQIFEIGIGTAKSVALITLKVAELRAAAILNPLLLPLIPLAAAQIPFAIGAGALSIGAVLAKPIPRYKDGLTHDYEGMAVVGDGGRSEAILRADGSVELTPAKDTLTHINKGDRVMPDADVWIKAIHAAALRDSNIKGVVTEKNYRDAMTKELSNKLDTLTHAVRSKRETHITGTHAGVMTVIKSGTSWTNYINSNT